LVVLLLALAAPRARAQPSEPPVDPAAAKAARVLTVIRSTDWPEAAFSAPDSPIVIGILGEGGASDALKRAAVDQRIRGRSVEVRQLPSPQPAPGQEAISETDLDDLARRTRQSHVLFVSESVRDRAQALLRRLGAASVLTVSDAEDFTSRGGMLDLVVREGHVVVDANPERIKNAQLRVGPEVLPAKDVDRATAIKAGMVLNFIRYTDWPAAAFAAPEDPIVIGMVGDGEMGVAVKRALLEQRVRGRALEVRQIPSLKAPPGRTAIADADLEAFAARVRAVHAVFICDSEREALDQILRRLGDSDVLTVSDIDSFAQRGGMLGLTIRRKRVAVEANPAKIQKTSLKVSSQLLRLAQTVQSREH
jgi:hypothetical protein